MAKTLVFDGVETNKQGSVFLRLRKFSSDGDHLGTHHIEFLPGSNIGTVLTAANNSLVEEKYVPFTDISQVELVAAATWTPENIAQVTAQVVEAIAVQQAAITEAAAKKLEAEAAAAKEIEDAKAREVAANEAKALAEAAEAAAKEAQAKADAALKAAQDAANALAAQEKAAAEKAAFDKAVADAVAKLAPVEAVA